MNFEINKVVVFPVPMISGTSPFLHYPNQIKYEIIFLYFMETRRIVKGNEYLRIYRIFVYLFPV